MKQLISYLFSFLRKIVTSKTCDIKNFLETSDSISLNHNTGYVLRSIIKTRSIYKQIEYLKINIMI